jgi:tetratricopeptide (TPR) repeat protein
MQRTRRNAAEALVLASSRDRLAGDIADASRLLELAAAFDGAVPRLAEEQQALQARRQELEAERERERLAAELQKRKRSVLNFARAGQFSDARAELERVEGQLPATDPFLTQDVPEAFAGGYRTLAAGAARTGEYERALRLAQAGLEYQPEDAGLLDARDRYAAQIAAAAAAPAPKPAPKPAPPPAGPDPVALERQVRAALTSRDPLPLEQVQATLRELRGALDGDDAAIADRLVPEALQTLGTMGSGRAAQQRRDRLLALFPGEPRIAAFQVVPPAPVAPSDPCGRNLASYGRRPQGRCQDVLADGGGAGPQLVVVPDGSVPGFAITRYEISIGEYNTWCATASGCTSLNGDPGMPATGVSLDDARAYATWLTGQTGYRYRIPTKEEWVYAASAGGNTGSNFNCRLRVGGALIRGSALEPQRSPSDQNAWGLLHHVGNAREWVLVGSGAEAVGGAFSDDLGDCNVQAAVRQDGSGDDRTGLRLLREHGGTGGAGRGGE